MLDIKIHMLELKILLNKKLKIKKNRKLSTWFLFNIKYCIWNKFFIIIMKYFV